MDSSYETLLAELAAIERQQQDLTLSPLDQRLLDQAWEDINDQLNELDTLEDLEWRDAREVIEEDERRTPTPPAPSPIRFAPSPPPLFFPPGAHLPPPPGVPPLSATRQQVPIPDDWRAIDPPLTPGFDDDEISRWNAIEDDREGCARCPGCHYCTGYGYDGADEI